eukprot:scaffold3177_cov86-Phaeocystis_antarctica.AAC.2
MKHVFPRLESPVQPGALAGHSRPASLCLLGVRLGGSISSADISCRRSSSHGGDASMSSSQAVLTMWSSQRRGRRSRAAGRRRGGGAVRGHRPRKAAAHAGHSRRGRTPGTPTRHPSSRRPGSSTAKGLAARPARPPTALAGGCNRWRRC